jgi:hypothetical protein
VVTELVPFAWVQKRDGRLAPFEADKISRALFAATESLKKPDPFLARELTDGILHFLVADDLGNPPATAQIAELVIKVVRELGQPTLARAFADGRGQKAERQATASLALPEPLRTGPTLKQLSAWMRTGTSPSSLLQHTAAVSLREYSLREVFTRDLVAAQTDELLTLTGLEAPLEIAGCVVSFPSPESTAVLEALQEVRQLAGSFAVLDGPEYLLAHAGTAPAHAARFVQALHIGLNVTDLKAVVNLHSAIAPRWAEDLASGPLFAGRQPMDAERRTALSEEFLHLVLQSDSGLSSVRIDWHLGPADFTVAAEASLVRLARRALDGAALSFVFDRPRRPLALAEGVDQGHPAVLLAVALHLPALLHQRRARLDPATFLQKLGSLARLALSAATQKRDFLRRHSAGRPALTSGFFLERARLVVIPVGLEGVTRTLFDQGFCAGGAALDFARQVVQRLHAVLQEDGRACLMDTKLDSLVDDTAFATPEKTGGLTSGDATAAVKAQLMAASALHAVAGSGTVTVLLPQNRPPSPEDVAGWLRYAWQHTEIVRLRFRGPAPSVQLATTLWQEEKE